MNKHIVESLAEPVGSLWKQLQASSKEKFFVAAPLSSTPMPIFNWVIENANKFSNWEKVEFVLMDEMVEDVTPNVVYTNENDPASYERFAKTHFLNPLQEKTGITLDVIKPSLENIESFNTPIDLLILALGIDGNYANVMPGTPLATGWHIAHLTENYRQTHTGSGGAYANASFSEYGMSLGPQQVLGAKNVAVIISGNKKHDLAERLLSYDHFNSEFPLSIIYHKDVQDKVAVYITEDVGLRSAF